MQTSTLRRSMVVAAIVSALVVLSATLITRVTPANAQMGPAACSCAISGLPGGGSLANCQCGANQCVVASKTGAEVALACMRP